MDLQTNIRPGTTAAPIKIVLVSQPTFAPMLAPNNEKAAHVLLFETLSELMHYPTTTPTDLCLPKSVHTPPQPPPSNAGWRRKVT